VGHERADVLLELVVKPPSSQTLKIGDDAAAADLIDDEDDDDDEDEEEEDDDTIVKDVACCLVCIRPNRMSRNKGHPVWFWWEMSLIEMSTTHDDDLFASVSSSTSSMEMTGAREGAGTITKWMVDCIQPDFEGKLFACPLLCHNLSPASDL
jgi:hypothetical protein